MGAASRRSKSKAEVAVLIHSCPDACYGISRFSEAGSREDALPISVERCIPIRMAKVAVHPSAVLAELLRRRREELGLSLRQVEARSAAAGERFHFATLAKVEQGKAELGIRRFHGLLKLYDLPIQLAGDLLELEELADTQPGPMPLDMLCEKGVEYWKKGDVRKALAHVFALRARIPANTKERLTRQKALLAMGASACALGRVALARHIVDGLLLEGPEPSLFPNVLIQAATCWHRLGSAEVALALLERAEAHVGPKDHQERGWVSHNKASALLTVGDSRGAEAAVQKALVAYRRAGDAFGEGGALGVQLRLLAERKDWKGMLKAARAAQEHARRHKLDRLKTARQLDEARALIALKEPAEALAVLKEALSWAIQQDDRLVRFYAHYHLWKAYEALGDASSAEAERRAADHHVQFVDEVTPEAREVRSRQAAEAGNGRRRRARKVR